MNWLFWNPFLTGMFLGGSMILVIWGLTNNI